MRRVARFRLLAVCWLLLASTESFAAELRPFVPGSMKQILAARQGKPFILGAWSLSCVHCRDDLQLLGRFVRKHPALDVVLIATDTPAETAALSATLKQYGLQRAEAWVFADEFSERLRFEIDRNWYGELPRTWFIAAGGESQGVSGKLDVFHVEQWVQDHVDPAHRRR
jgi:thiol-disulfide isomerase/thioredoxin